MPPRPKCRRCGAGLDFTFDQERGRWHWHCNGIIVPGGRLRPTIKPMRTDEAVQAEWERLPGDAIAQLEKELMESEP